MTESEEPAALCHFQSQSHTRASRPWFPATAHWSRLRLLLSCGCSVRADPVQPPATEYKYSRPSLSVAELCLRRHRRLVSCSCLLIRMKSFCFVSKAKNIEFSLGKEKCLECSTRKFHAAHEPLQSLQKRRRLKHNMFILIFTNLWLSSHRKFSSLFATSGLEFADFRAANDSENFSCSI